MRHIDLNHPVLAAAFEDCANLEAEDLLTVAAAVEEGLARANPDAKPVSDEAFREAYITALQWVDRVRLNTHLVALIAEGKLCFAPHANPEEHRFFDGTGAGLARVVIHHDGERYVAAQADQAQAALSAMLEDIAAGTEGDDDFDDDLDDESDED
jgi:hypothetical protein